MSWKHVANKCAEKLIETIGNVFFGVLDLDNGKLEYVIIPSTVPQAAVVQHPQLDKPLFFVTTALRSMLTEEEFKAVMLHEVGHVEHEHLDNMIRAREEWAEGVFKQAQALPTHDPVQTTLDVIALVVRSFKQFPKARQIQNEIEADNFAARSKYGYELLKALKKLRKSWWIRLSREGSKELDIRIDKLENRYRFEQMFHAVQCAMVGLRRN